MRFRVLGAVELVDAQGRTRPIGSANQRTLLAVLLACRGEVVSIDALVDALWAAGPPRSAVPTLRTYVSRLRSHLGTALASRRGGFALTVLPGELDAERFETLVDAAHHADTEEAPDLLVAALDLWRGPAFGDRADVERVRAEAHRLEERRTAAREAHAAALLTAGRVDEAVAAAEALVTAAPLREGGWAVLIEALTRAHRSAEALGAFRRAAEALAEVGLDRLSGFGKPSGRPSAASGPRHEPSSRSMRHLPGLAGSGRPSCRRRSWDARRTSTASVSSWTTLAS